MYECKLLNKFTEGSPLTDAELECLASSLNSIDGYAGNYINLTEMEVDLLVKGAYMTLLRVRDVIAARAEKPKP
jgi:hypothetical protein